MVSNKHGFEQSNQLIKSCRKVNKVAISCLRLFAKQFGEGENTGDRGCIFENLDKFSSLQVCDLNHGAVGLFNRDDTHGCGRLLARCAVHRRDTVHAPATAIRR